VTQQNAGVEPTENRTPLVRFNQRKTIDGLRATPIPIALNVFPISTQGLFSLTTTFIISGSQRLE